jgi:hypothetical protein
MKRQGQKGAGLNPGLRRTGTNVVQATGAPGASGEKPKTLGYAKGLAKKKYGMSMARAGSNYVMATGHGAGAGSSPAMSGATDMEGKVSSRRWRGDSMYQDGRGESTSPGRQ